MSGNLIVSEIYASIQGESTFAGLPCTFIRLTGCSLRCKWCDTAHAFSGGSERTLVEIVEAVDALALPVVELTGGEPLEQEACFPLMQTLVDKGYRVLLETSGAVSIAAVPGSVHIVMDVKCPDSGMSARNLPENIVHLKASDDVKFVVASRDDFDFAKQYIATHGLLERCNVLVSPAFGLCKPMDLAAWTVADLPRARMQIQMHKYIWHPRAKGV